MQALYAFFQGSDDRIDKAEKAMMQNTERIFDLYILQWSAMIEVVDIAREYSEVGKQKYFPSDAERNPVMKFVENRVIRQIEDNTDYKRHFEALRINWADEKEMFRRLYLNLRNSELYKDYMSSGKSSFEEDRRFIINFYKDFLSEFEELQQIYEEKNIFWVDDYDIVSYMIVKTLNILSTDADKHAPLPDLFLKAGESEEDEMEDKAFMKDLFRRTIVHAQEYEVLIAEKAANWELERIAMMDSLLLKMAICELTSFPSIPVKVTLNEYIEISKIYSSNKSKVFINGILDKLIVELKADDRIKKTGRGLME
jgi:N utilization substance protein B